jgi:hypothetical protein
MPVFVIDDPAFGGCKGRAGGGHLENIGTIAK